MANLRTEDRNTVHTRDPEVTTAPRTTRASSGGAGWIIALIVLVALAIAAWIYSDYGTTTAVDVDNDVTPRVTTEPAAPPATTAPEAEAPAPATPEVTTPVAPETPPATAPAGEAPAPTIEPATPPADGAAPGTTVPAQ